MANERLALRLKLVILHNRNRRDGGREQAEISKERAIMIIVKNEMGDTSNVGICEECGNETYVRKIEVRKSAFGGSGRGWYSLCYKCWTPRVFWRKSENDQTIYESPA